MSESSQRSVSATGAAEMVSFIMTDPLLSSPVGDVQPLAKRVADLFHELDEALANDYGESLAIRSFDALTALADALRLPAVPPRTTDPIQRLHNLVDALKNCDACEATTADEDSPVVLCGKCDKRLKAELADVRRDRDKYHEAGQTQKARAETAEAAHRKEHLAFVAVMNALDVHMPPDGSKLLKELREIAATEGYPFQSTGSPAVRSLDALVEQWLAEARKHSEHAERLCESAKATVKRHCAQELADALHGCTRPEKQ